MARKIEFGAGIAAAALAALGLVALLLAPLPFCTVPTSVSRCPPGHIRSLRLIEARLDSSVWVYVIGMVVFLLAGAAGAIAEARYTWRAGALLLWAAAILAFMGCSIGAAGVLGLMYLPGVLALLLAGYASVLQRFRRTPGSRMTP
ncbi:MAG: hypothetical protein ACLQUY_08125 [Ktedonobacterales bacterium]